MVRREDERSGARKLLTVCDLVLGASCDGPAAPLPLKFMNGSAIAASTQKIDGRLFSERTRLPDSGAPDGGGSVGVEGVGFNGGTALLSFEIEVSPQQLQLGDEVFVAARNDSDVADR